MKFQTHTLLALAILLAAFTSTFAADPENSTYTDLTTNGVPLANGTKAKLPVFTMDDGLTGEAQDKVIANLLAANPNAPTLENFMKNKVTAPYDRIDTNIPNSTSHQIDLYFIAYGPLKTVADGGFWKARMGGGNKNAKMVFLTDPQLKQRKLTVIDQPTLKERYAHADVDLFEMVQVSATARAMESIGKESVVIAFMIDPIFLNDKQFPNEWRSIKFGANGAALIGNPNPYDGVGAYSKITELKNTAGALFVEYHIIYDEPQGWFNGKPVMKSKLGTMIDNDVRSFRNDLKLGPSAPAAAQPAPVQPAAQPPAAAPKAGGAAPAAPPAAATPKAGAAKDGK